MGQDFWGIDERSRTTGSKTRTAPAVLHSANVFLPFTSHLLEKLDETCLHKLKIQEFEQEIIIIIF
jgi:hypothetical protein